MLQLSATIVSVLVIRRCMAKSDHAEQVLTYFGLSKQHGR